MVPHSMKAVSLFTTRRASQVVHDAGFPNMTASYLEDCYGNPYADISDFLSIGIPSSAIAWTVIVTLGYSIMFAMGW